MIAAAGSRNVVVDVALVEGGRPLWAGVAPHLEQQLH